MVVQLFKNSDYYQVSKQRISRRPTEEIVNVKVFISGHIRGANVEAGRGEDDAAKKLPRGVEVPRGKAIASGTIHH